jgi:hypothetical protein
MGFGLDVKVEAPKVEVPKVDVAAAAKSAASAATGAVSGAVDSAKSAVNSAVDSAKGAVKDAVGAVTADVNSAVDAATDAVESVKASLSTVAGAIAEVAVSFTGAIEDIVLEPHLSLDANASFGKTKFEKGPVKIKVEHTPEEAKINEDLIHIYSGSGGYDKMMKVSEYVSDDGKSVMVQFDDAPMDETYSLEVIYTNGRKQTMFTGIPYGDLRNTKNRFV